MKQILAHVSGIPVSSLSMAYPNRLFLEPASGQSHIPPPSNGPLKLKQLSLGLKISETVKGKLSLGAKIIRVGGVEKIFKHNFSIREGEKLSKASQCYFSTTAGPIAGLFISTDKVAFCSERSIKLSYSNGQAVRIHYKVSIPLIKIKRANESQNTKRPSRKYIEIVTMNNFDFWFMRLLNYRGTFKYLQQALSQAQ
ncbi:hypothetical protein TEA_024851 [Camellia sinensis var. sinensis]|uniref:GRAM domain-containing protein n=1 Tax=Camellia sinensis var. sinensis TaxID=542762 RepID=A0A4S4EDN3_CAMSN|nr:hypothetical protein TEA_024851 [Camellia sinensis var. sinensis]